jgi:hypothetical protein
MAIDMIILIVSLFVLVAILKPFTFPGGESTEDTSSIVITTLALLAYFYGVDFFPISSPLGFLHILTIGLVNAMAMIDLFVTTVVGMPLSIDFLFVFVLPAMIVYRLSRFIMKYLVIFSDRTTFFIGLIMAFLSIVGAATGVFNPIHWFFGAIAALTAYFLSGASLLAITVNIFVACLMITCLGVVMEFMSTLFVEKVVGSMGG